MIITTSTMDPLMHRTVNAVKRDELEAWLDKAVLKLESELVSKMYDLVNFQMTKKMQAYIDDMMETTISTYFKQVIN